MLPFKFKTRKPLAFIFRSLDQRGQYFLKICSKNKKDLWAFESSPSCITNNPIFYLNDINYEFTEIFERLNEFQLKLELHIVDSKQKYIKTDPSYILNSSFPALLNNSGNLGRSTDLFDTQTSIHEIRDSTISNISTDIRGENKPESYIKKYTIDMRNLVYVTKELLKFKGYNTIEFYIQFKEGYYTLTKEAANFYVKNKTGMTAQMKQLIHLSKQDYYEKLTHFAKAKIRLEELNGYKKDFEIRIQVQIAKLKKQKEMNENIKSTSLRITNLKVHLDEKLKHIKLLDKCLKKVIKHFKEKKDSLIFYRKIQETFRNQFEKENIDYLGKKDKLMVYQRIFEVRKLKLEFVLGNVFYCEPAFKIFRGLKYAPNCIGERGELMDTKIATSLGYVAFMLNSVSKYLNFPVCYPMYFNGSRSMIAKNQQDYFPLFMGRNDKTRMLDAYRLLLQNLKQTLLYFGMNYSTEMTNEGKIMEIFTLLGEYLSNIANDSSLVE